MGRDQPRRSQVSGTAIMVSNADILSGYTDSCRTIVSAARNFASIIKSRFPEDLYVLGDPKVSVVAFASRTIDVLALGDVMSKKGWHLNGLANPPALHMAFTVSDDSLEEDCTDALVAFGG